MRINDQIEIADWALTESFARASGPAGSGSEIQVDSIGR
jgi:hypothetical protein